MYLFVAMCTNICTIQIYIRVNKLDHNENDRPESFRPLVCAVNVFSRVLERLKDTRVHRYRRVRHQKVVSCQQTTKGAEERSLRADKRGREQFRFEAFHKNRPLKMFHEELEIYSARLLHLKDSHGFL